jgi:general stress protein 26
MLWYAGWSNKGNYSTMTRDLTVPFLQEKIQELQNALFFAELNSLLTIPTHVITAEVVDDAAQIWFVVPSTSRSAHEFDKEFSAKLDFFKKGKDFYLKVKGIATIVTDEKEMIGFDSKEIRKRIQQGNAMVIKVKVQQADYFASTSKPAAQNWIKNSGAHIFNWLLNPEYDQENPQLVAIPITLD